MITGIHFPEIAGYSTTAVALIHPCLRHPSLRHRTYRGLTGDAAEILMIEDARSISLTTDS